MLGFIGGSGLYQIEEISNVELVTISSSFGNPSDDILLGELEGDKIAFLPRHGRKHTLNPSEINYRANIDVMKQLGVTELVSLSAVGSLEESISPGTFVIVEQFVDKTYLRKKTFYEEGLVAHVSLADPTCKFMNRIIREAAKDSSIEIHENGVYVVIEGPQFSGKMESEIYRNLGCSVIGMTNMPEAKLAREAEICYSTIAMVTDYDCWHPSHDSVTVEMILQQMAKNVVKAKKIIPSIARQHGKSITNGNDCGCKNALDDAIVTGVEDRNPSSVARCKHVAGRVLSK